MLAKTEVATPRLRGGCLEVAQRQRTCGRRLEKIMGHQTFASLLARRSLSILFASYKLARADYSKPLQTWRSVREELETFGSLVPCLEAHLRLPWSDMCQSSDASLAGSASTMRSASVHDVSHIGRLRENVDSIAKKKPSDLASTHSPCARLSIHRLSTNMTMMFDLSCCVTRMRYLQVLRSSKRLKMFRVLYYSFSSIGRSSRHSDGVVLRTLLFLEATSALYAARNARVRVREPSRSVGQSWFGVCSGQRSKFPPLHVKQHLEKVLQVASAAR